MRWVLSAALLAAVAGCGRSENELAGTDWILPHGACAEAVSFNHSDGYAMAYGCLLPSGDAGVQVEKGDYVVAYGSKLLTYPAKTSCLAQSSMESATFVYSGSTLTIQTADSVLEFMRTNPSDATGVAVLGCFNEDGSFTPGPLVDF